MIFKKLIALVLVTALFSEKTLAQILPANYQASTPLNYVRSWELSVPETNESNVINRLTRDVKQTTQYLDGLGRLVQTVFKEGSKETVPTPGQPNPADLVTSVHYDEFGRVQYNFLPFAANNNGGNASTVDGNFKYNPFQQQAYFLNNQFGPGVQGETYFYAKTNFESSPLNRIVESYAPGNSWVGSEGLPAESQRKNTQIKYYLNTPTDDVKIWNVLNGSPGQLGTYSVSGSYSSSQLSKTISIDENKKQVVEFKDKNGQIILKKVQLLNGYEDNGSGAGYPGWLSTYYIYDDLNNLRCVIQPEAVKLMSTPNNWDLTSYLDEQCFRYEYDHLNQLIIKKIPGAGKVELIYDAKGRLVMVQDANMLNAKYVVTKYDLMNRPIETGIWLNGSSPASHRLSSNTQNTYPVISGSYDLLSKTNYDNYAGLPSVLSSAFNSTWATHFNSSFNTSHDYAQQQLASSATLGMVTWSQVKVLDGSNTYLYSVNIYDAKGRLIQIKSMNITGAEDVVTTQYNWVGQPILVVQSNVSNSSNQTTVMVTKMTYDDLGRSIKTEKKVSNSLVNSGGMPSAFKIINQSEYDKLGQLKTKKLGTGPSSGSSLTTLDFEYNIRGWILGINRAYLSAGSSSYKYFGMELAYDKLNTLIGPGYATPPQYNGNISGIQWKSEGDRINRQYDFAYDNVNRLMKGDFRQLNTDNSFSNSQVNYNMKMGDGSDPTSAYDFNGNIKRMQQWGLKVTSSSQIDDLRYDYMVKSNKLKSVTDFLNDPATKLADFKTNTSHPQSSFKSSLTLNSAQSQFDQLTDYGYDDNGNLTSDFNKNIVANQGGTGIRYNHLNLPEYINVGSKGSIQYKYDASGNKLQKEVYDIATGVTKITQYINGLVFEDGVLQFIPHEEGRVRFKPAVGSIAASLQYDYMLKDHLGNVRMVLTEEVNPLIYHTLSFEGDQNTAQVDNQNAIWEDASGNSINVINKRTTIAALQNANLTPAPLTYSTLVRSSTCKIGAGKLLKVMAGDKIQTSVQYYYNQNNPASPTGLNTLVSALANILLNSIGSTPLIKTNSNSIPSVVNSNTNINSFFNNQSSNSGSDRPKAYLNVLYFDEQFNFDSESSYGEQIGSSSIGQILIGFINPSQAKKNGYCYIYISNESDNLVYFDNLTLMHEAGPILEETHYYPFGLTMAGISSKAAGTLENRKQYNGIEHSTDLDLNQYDAFYRTLDPQIGRFWQIDPQTEVLENYSPYESMGNNPITNVDPMGDFKTRFGAWLHKVFNGGEVGQNYSGEYYVSKTGSSSSEDGNVTMTANVTYGKGRDRLSSAREKLLDEVNQQADDEQTRRNLTDAGLWNPNLNQDQANRNTAGLAFGTSISNLLVRPISIATSINKVLPNSTPIIRSLGAASRAEMLARQLKMNINSATTRQVLNSLDETVEAFISKYRKPSIRSEFPGEYLGKTVEEALKTGNTTVRKLLTSTRFVK